MLSKKEKHQSSLNLSVSEGNLTKQNETRPPETENTYHKKVIK